MTGYFIAAGLLVFVGLVVRHFVREARRSGALEQHNKQLKEDADAAQRANEAASAIDTSPDGVLRDENNRLKRGGLD